MCCSQGCEDWCFKDKAEWTEKCKWSACEPCAPCKGAGRARVRSRLKPVVLLCIVHLAPYCLRTVSLVTEVKCPVYKTFPTGVEGGAGDPCKPDASFQLSSTTDPSCSLRCKAGYEQKEGEGMSTLQCGKDGQLSGDLNCTGE